MIADDGTATNGYPHCEHRPNTKLINVDPCEACPPGSAAAGAAEKVPVLSGEFAFYEDGKGGYALTADTVEFGHIEKRLPAALVKLVTGGGIVSRKLAGLVDG